MGSVRAGAAPRRGNIHSATQMNGRYDAALSAKHATAPTLAISTPAIAGPRMRERLNCVAFSASADAIWLRLTMVGTIDENDGIESASVMPTISDSATTIHGCTVPVSRRTTRAAGHSIWIDWNVAITRRRSARSANSPPASVRSQAGAASTKASSPITKDDAPRLSSSHGSATCWAQVPIFERRLAKTNVPKRRVCKSASDLSKAPIY